MIGGALLGSAAIVVAFSVTGAISCGRSAEPSEHARHNAAAPLASPAAGPGAHGGGPLPEGYAPVELGSAQAKAIGLTTAKIARRPFAKTQRTVGVVSLDETRTAHVHAKVRGVIETVEADFLGKSVKAGAPLCTIYSQAVYAAELELAALVAQRSEASSEPSLPTSAVASQGKTWDTLLAASKRRLALWDVPKGQIESIARGGEPSRTFSVFAPRAGVVVSRRAVAGNYVEPSTELYGISDLSKLWVLVDVYEADVPLVSVGTPVKLIAEGRTDAIEAKVSFLSPTIDETTRTLKVRVEVDNATGALRPGAFVNAEMALTLGEGLAIPESAVIRTGARNIVFVVHGTHIEPREVKVGALIGDVYRVDSGLAAGDDVATGAQFLIDSESRLRATSGGGGGHAGHGG